MTRILVPLMVLLIISGCSRIAESRFNPMNLFNRGTTEATPQDARPLVPQERVVGVVDNRALAQSISAVEVTRTNGGTLVRASGAMATSGSYSAQLVTAGLEGNTLVLAVRAFTGGNGGRNVTVARFFDDGELRGIRSVQVTSATNQITRSVR